VLMLLLLVTPKQLPSQALPAEGRSVDLGVAVSQANWKVAERLYKKYGTVNFPMSSSDQPPDALARVVAGGRYPSNVFSATGGIDWLLARGASIDGCKGAPLRSAVADKTGELLTFLLEKGANPHLFDPAKDAPLHFAMSDGSWKCFDILMARRVDVNKQVSQEGQTPLMWAAQYGNEKIAKRLIMAGANLNMRQPTTQMRRESSRKERPGPDSLPVCERHRRKEERGKTRRSGLIFWRQNRPRKRQN
jgi:ankyrin repeat protein